ncbi:MAG TPA: TIGR02147 family protein [Fibrobacteraceae bacterium]|nr:TIGR02147 family protein [Fibrobacteraceae bacterium]
MRDIFQYLDYRDFLRDFQAECQASSSGFSARSFLKKAGIGSPSFFKQVLAGERNLTENTTGQFLLALRLKAHEADYFRTLVRFTQASSAEEKQMLYERLRALGSQAKVRVVGEAQYAFYEYWYIPVLRELLCQEPFLGDYAALARRLRPAISAAEARQGVRTLLDLGFVVQGEGGIWRQVDPLLHTGFAVQSLAVRSFNRQMVQLAAESLERAKVSERCVVGVTLSVTEDAYQKMTAEIQAFQERMLALAAESSEADRVYQMQLMLFPVTQSSNGGKK